MKLCKRTLAIVLSLCMLLSVMVFSVSAEDAAPQQKISLSLRSVKAVEKKADDPETVLRLAMELSVSDTAAAFTDVNKDAEISIYEGLYVYAYSAMASTGAISVSEQDIFDTALIAKAKPVDYKDGVLTVDVLTKDGKEKGAKMISIVLDGVEEDFGLFIINAPEGVLKNTDGSVISGAFSGQVNISDLSQKTFKLPALVRSIWNDINNGNVPGLIRKGLFAIPFALIIIPILLATIENRAQKIYDVYNINVHKVVRDAWKVLRKLVPALIGSMK